MTAQVDQVSPQEIWLKAKATKYSDDNIRRTINYSLDCGDPDWSKANAAAAQAMIAYNEMIDNRIQRAMRSQGMRA